MAPHMPYYAAPPANFVPMPYQYRGGVGWVPASQPVYPAPHNLHSSTSTPPQSTQESRKVSNPYVPPTIHHRTSSTPPPSNSAPYAESASSSDSNDSDSYRKVLDLDGQIIGRSGKMTHSHYNNYMQFVHERRNNGVYDDAFAEKMFLYFNKERNAKLDSDTIDLHYLLSHLARDVMAERIDNIRRDARLSRVLYVCTGRGRNNIRKNKSVLGEIVIEIAKKEGIHCKYMKGNDGVIIMEFPDCRRF